MAFPHDHLADVLAVEHIGQVTSAQPGELLRTVNAFYDHYDAALTSGQMSRPTAAVVHAAFSAGVHARCREVNDLIDDQDVAARQYAESLAARVAVA